MCIVFYDLFKLGFYIMIVCMMIILFLVVNIVFNGFLVLGLIFVCDGFLLCCFYVCGDCFVYFNGILIFVIGVIILVLVFNVFVIVFI